MRDAFRVPLAIAVGVLVVTAAAFGGVMFVDDDVHTLDDAADSLVEETEAQLLLGFVVGASVAAGTVAVYDVLTDNGVNKSKLEELDALETKVSLHENAQTQKQNNEIITDSFGNYLEDTKSIALIEGKNAYINALNNGSTQAQAQSAATQAVSGYYAVKQQQLIASWNTSATVANQSRNVAIDTTDVSSHFVQFGPDNAVFPDHDITSTQVTLVNSSTKTVLAYEVAPESDLSTRNTVGLTSGTRNVGGNNASYVLVQPPNQNYGSVSFANFDAYADRWAKIETQNTDVQAQIDTFINNTYDSYQEGTINNTDLVDPYLGAREMSPEGEFQSWALSTLTQMDFDSPTNLSTVGEMVVQDSYDDVEREGILLSQETPTNGFEFNTTYNATELDGAQVMVTTSTTAELEGEFTVIEATDADGTEVEDNITYRNITYNTTSTEEYQNLMQNLTEMQAEIEANQQQERSGGGGGLFPGFGLGGIGGVGGVALIAAAGGAFLLARD